MLTENGGELVIEQEIWSLKPFFDASDRIRIKRTSNDLVRETASAQSGGAFLRSASLSLPTAWVTTLSFFQIRAEQSVLQAVVFMWSHETGELDKVADDFSELR